MKKRNPYKSPKRSNKTFLALLLVPIAAIWDKIYNVTHRRKVHGWRRIFG